MAVSPIDISRATEINVGIDFGYRWSAATWWAKIGDTHYQFDELQVEKTLAEEFAKQVKARGVDHRYKFYADWADPASMRRFADAGLRCIPANKNMLDGIECMRSLMRSGKLKIFKHCGGTIRDIRNYVWKDPSANGEIKDIVKKKNDHRIDASRYALHTSSKTVSMPWKQPPTSPVRLIGKGGPVLPSVMRATGGLPGFFGRTR